MLHIYINPEWLLSRQQACTYTVPSPVPVPASAISHEAAYWKALSHLKVDTAIVGTCVKQLRFRQYVLVYITSPNLPESACTAVACTGLWMVVAGEGKLLK